MEAALHLRTVATDAVAAVNAKTVVVAAAAVEAVAVAAANVKEVLDVVAVVPNPICQVLIQLQDRNFPTLSEAGLKNLNRLRIVFYFKLNSMKTSKYNIFADNAPRNVVCYNSLRDSYCVLSNRDALLLRENLDELAEKSPNVHDALIEKGFIIDDATDEFELLKNEYNKAIDSNNVYRLTILPSLDCNLRCWYCFEKHVQGSHLEQETADAIFNHVVRVFELQPDLRHLEVELFGGEPLLYLKDELYPLLKRIKDYITSIDKTVSFFFVTNAVCVNEETIPLLADLDASFQISIDGFKDRHDKVKYIPETGEGTYNRMIRTVRLIQEKIDYSYINLRINYDDETLEHMPELMVDLDFADRDRIGVHLERVWQTGDKATNDNQRLKEMINLWMSRGFAVSYMNLSRRSFSCKASSRNQLVAACDGAVYKCTGRDFTCGHQDGSLNADGTVDWKEDKLNERMMIVTFDNDMCRDCRFLPLCWGPCCQKQMESGPHDLERYCQKRNMELKLSDYILYRFNNAYIMKHNCGKGVQQ